MDEFSMLYDEWTSCEIEKIEKNYTAKELVLLAEMKYQEEGCKEKTKNLISSMIRHWQYIRRSQ